jgi:hypothetical protein
VALTNALALSAVRECGMTSTAAALVLPLATGASIALVLSALRARRRGASIVVWSRIDQKSAFKCIAAAGARRCWPAEIAATLARALSLSLHLAEVAGVVQRARRLAHGRAAAARGIGLRGRQRLALALEAARAREAQAAHAWARAGREAREEARRGAARGEEGERSARGGATQCEERRTCPSGAGAAPSRSRRTSGRLCRRGDGARG